jgi:hypothetical protein
VDRHAGVRGNLEPVDNFREAFPSFQLEDELFVEGGRDIVYTLRKKPWQDMSCNQHF